MRIETLEEREDGDYDALVHFEPGEASLVFQAGLVALLNELKNTLKKVEEVDNEH